MDHGMAFFKHVKANNQESFSEKHRRLIYILYKIK